MKRTNPFLCLSSAGKALVLSLILVSFNSCQKSEEVIPATTDSNVDVEMLTGFLSTTTGFQKDLITYEATSKVFIINDDILVDESDARERYGLRQGGRTDQWRWYYLVGNNYVTNVDYYFETDVPSYWKTATQKGIQNWNAINGTRLFLRETTTRASADVVVKMGYENANWIARAYLPSSTGRPGSSVTINSKYNTLSATYKEFAMTHEMGHNIGLTHTDQTSGYFIEGTPSTDRNSVMNSVVLPWQGFTTGDVTAIQALYP